MEQNPYKPPVAQVELPDLQMPVPRWLKAMVQWPVLTGLLVEGRASIVNLSNTSELLTAGRLVRPEMTENELLAGTVLLPLLQLAVLFLLFYGVWRFSRVCAVIIVLFYAYRVFVYSKVFAVFAVSGVREFFLVFGSSALFVPFLIALVGTCLYQRRSLG